MTAPTVTAASPVSPQPPVAPRVAPIAERVRVAACLLVVWTVAFAQAPGRIVADTKTDLALDPVGLMSRSLHLWDPSGTFGLLQNQGYGYLFPMGPFSAALGAVLPAWIVQRLWWGALLTVGYLATRRLLAALPVGDPAIRHLAGLAYVLSPRILSTLGPISSEAAPALLAPAILAPLVLAYRCRWSTRRAAALSGLAILACGGVNATATLLAVIPAGLWLVTRPGWWRARLTWWWTAAVLAATAWWAVPLVTLGRYSPPFLDWIESSDAVSRNISMLDSLRGTSHWLGHLVTTGGPWWDAGFRLVSAPVLIVATCVVAAAGLAGLAAPDMNERTWLLLSALTGLTLLALPHAGVLASPLAGDVQALLDGPLAPLRNVHKADPILRLPLAVGLAQALCWLRQMREHARRPRLRVLASTSLCLAAVTPLVTASPGLAGQLASRGAFGGVPREWHQAGRWLDRHNPDGTALVVPAANFDEYRWGRPMDLVLRSVTTTRIAVRDAVPLVPANTIRMLDSLESRLQGGREIGGAVEVMRRSGIRYLVLRNDLDTTGTGAVPVPLTRSALTSTPGVHLVQGFGRAADTLSGQRLRPVEIFEVTDPLAEPRAQTWPVSSVTSASGASESLAPMADAGVLDGPVVFDGDAAALPADLPLAGARRVVADGLRSRDRAFGAIRGRDVSATLPSTATAVRDYLPWPSAALRTTVSYDGALTVGATSSLAQQSGPTGLSPAFRPFAALDGDATTAWVGYAHRRPALTVTFAQPRSLQGLEISGYADRDRFGGLLGIPTRLRLQTDSGIRDVDVPGTGRPTAVQAPEEPTRRLTVAILDTDRGSRALVTGLSEIRIPGLVVRETAHVPSAATTAPDAYVLSGPDGASDGCLVVEREFRCGGEARDAEDSVSLDRTLPSVAGSTYTATGTLAARPGPGIEARLDTGRGVTVSASSRRSRAPEARPAAVLDGDPATAWSPSSGDGTPTLVLDFERPVQVSEIALDLRGRWLAKRKPTAQVTVDGHRALAPVARDGTISLHPVTGRRVTLQLLIDPNDPNGAASLEIAELHLSGVTARALPARIAAGCGGGPRLLVDGRTVPTSVSGPGTAAYGVTRLAWSACAPLTLAGPTSRVVVEEWGGFVPDAATLTSGAGRASAEATRSLAVTSSGPGALDLTLGAGTASIVALTQNANPGWRATLDDRALQPVTVDGWRQGFVAPAGSGGAVQIRFGPDRVYRLGLLAGLVLVILLVGAAVRPERHRPPPAEPPPAARLPVSPGWPAAAVAIAMGLLLAGGWGTLAGLAGALAAWLLRRHTAWSALVAAVLVIGAGLLQAVVAPGQLGPSWLEGALRLSCLAAVSLVLCAGGFANGPSPWRAPRPTVPTGPPSAA